MINEYVCRKVALKDLQPCLICGKPSTTVLHNGSGPDWFYSCDIHLKDNPQFVTPVYSNDYEAHVEKIKSLKQQIAAITKNTDPSAWDSWVTKFYNNKSKTKAYYGKEEEQVPDAQHASDLKKEYGEIVDKILELQKKNTKFKLSDVMFESRVQRLKDEHMMRERRRQDEKCYTNTNPDELLGKFNFPTIPKDIK